MKFNTVKTDAHKDTALSFLREVIDGKIRDAYAKYLSPELRHHNPAFAGDALSLERAMQENHALFPDKTIDVKHVLEDGDLVAVHSNVRMNPDQDGYAVVHLFRFEGDRIAEMWDIIQEVPSKSPNQNGMF